MFISKLNDKECQIGIKYGQEFNREMQTRDQQVFFDKYSILSLLVWSRLESEVPFGMNLVNDAYVAESCPSSVKIKNMTISATKS